MSVSERIKRGFTINGKHPIETEDWLYDKDASTDNKLIFYGYDANLYPMPMLSTWPSTKHKDKVIMRAIEHTKGFVGEVWVDDIQVRDSQGNTL